MGVIPESLRITLGQEEEKEIKQLSETFSAKTNLIAISRKRMQHSIPFCAMQFGLKSGKKHFLQLKK